MEGTMIGLISQLGETKDNFISNVSTQTGNPPDNHEFTNILHQEINEHTPEKVDTIHKEVEATEKPDASNPSSSVKKTDQPETSSENTSIPKKEEEHVDTKGSEPSTPETQTSNDKTKQSSQLPTTVGFENLPSQTNTDLVSQTKNGVLYGYTSRAKTQGDTKVNTDSTSEVGHHSGKKEKEDTHVDKKNIVEETVGVTANVPIQNNILEPDKKTSATADEKHGVTTECITTAGCLSKQPITTKQENVLLASSTTSPSLEMSQANRKVLENKEGSLSTKTKDVPKQLDASWDSKTTFSEEVASSKKGTKNIEALDSSLAKNSLKQTTGTKSDSDNVRKTVAEPLASIAADPLQKEKATETAAIETTDIKTTSKLNPIETPIGLQVMKAVKEFKNNEKNLTTTAVSELTNSAPLTSIGGLTSTDKNMSIVSSHSVGAHLSIDAPVTSSNFVPNVFDKLMSLSQSHVNTAHIELNPAELGPLNVKLELQNGQANVTFMSSQEQVRTILQEAAPGLKDMFQGAGLNLVNVNVSSHSFGQGQSHSQSQGGPYQFSEKSSDNSIPVVAIQKNADLIQRVIRTGGWDYYA